jgi:peptidoglycan L-alanyl-D-glutamate endopeptidase CwlK
MPSHQFSKSSLDRLEGVNHILADLCFRVLYHRDCTVIYGKRTIEEQLKLVNEGLSKTMNSYHLPQEDGKAWAVDLAPYPIDWKNTKQFYWLAGMMKVLAELYLPDGYYLRWGGNWDSDEDLDDQSFMDLVHYELRKK